MSEEKNSQVREDVLSDEKILVIQTMIACGIREKTGIITAPNHYISLEARQGAAEKINYLAGVIMDIGMTRPDLLKDKRDEIYKALRESGYVHSAIVRDLTLGNFFKDYKPLERD